MERYARDREPTDREPAPSPRDLLAAIGILSFVPLPRPAPSSQAFARATLFFPFVGLLIGAALAGFNWALAGRLPQWLLAGALVGVWEALGGAATLQAWRAWWNAGKGGGWRGDAAATGVLAAKVLCLGLRSGAQPAALLFAPMLARWCIVVLATGARDAATPARKFNAAITFREFALTSVFTLAVVFAVAEAFGIFLVVCVAAVALGLRLLVHRAAGGVSWRFLLASAQAIETLVTALAAAV